MIYDCAVIGTGPAGLSAALNLKIHNKNFLWFGSKALSEKIRKAEQILNYPGFYAASGEDLQKAFLDQAEKMDLEIQESMINEIAPFGDHYALMAGADFFEAKTVILATGVSVKATLKNEAEYLGRGVSYCATCDGSLYRGKKIAVLCNNARFEHEVRYLADLAAEVLYFPQYAGIGTLPENVTVLKERILGIEGAMKVNALDLFSGKIEIDGIFILRDSISCTVTDNEYIPLNYSTSRLDGKLPSVFLADEVGALPNAYALEAMRSGQLTILNKLGCVISTKYPKSKNPFEDEVGYAKRILDGVVEDETVFALLYEPDDPTPWMTDDLVLIHGNPLALEVPEIMEDLKKKRQQAIEVEARRENFLCKHCNVIYQGQGTESYVPVADLIACRVDHIDWAGREVYLGVDLSMTNDNTAVSMAAYDQETGHVLVDSVCFVPEDRVEEKTAAEKCDYPRYIEAGKCVACGNRTIDYGVVEDWVFDIERKYGVTVMGIGFDRYNCLSSAQKWEAGRDGRQGYPTCEVRQHSSVLHPPVKWLAEMITDGKLEYERNELLEINFENARCAYDTNMNRYVNKKKSSGKVDMVVSLINAVYMLQQNVIFAEVIDWGIQVI